MAENELATTGDNFDQQFAGLIPEDVQLQKYTEQDAEAISGGGFLPRLQVMGSNTDLVKEGKCTMGVHALVFTKDRFTELGKEVPFLSLTFRTKALRIPKDGSNPMSYFDRNTAEFKKVMVDSVAPNSGCMFGPEFLIWLPNPGAFATYFFGNPTMRRSAPALLSIMKAGEGTFRPRPALSKINFIKNQKTGFSWHGAIIEPYSTPLPTPGEEFTTSIKDEVDRFLNPPASQEEKAEEAAGDDRAR